MTIKKALIWSLIKNERHPLLAEEEKQRFSAKPILDQLFPGIYYYMDVHPSPSGFHSVLKNYGIPVLKKIFPEVEKLHHSQISKTDMFELKPFLKSNGYEWRDNQNWKKKFNELLMAELVTE